MTKWLRQGWLWLLGLLLLLPVSPAWADKVVEPLMFNADDGAITVISLYETNPTTQAAAVKSFYKISKSFYKAIPGFYGLALFSSGDGARVMELTQWQDQPSYETFQPSLTDGDGADDYTQYYEKYTDAKGGKDKGKDDEVGLGEPFLTAVFATEQVVSPPGMVSAIPAMALVQLSDIAADTPEQQLKLIDAAKVTLASLPQLYPSPRTAVLMRGIDTDHIALLTNWGSVAEFSNLDLVPELILDTAEGEDPPVTTDNRLYKTVKIITPKPEKYGKG